VPARKFEARAAAKGAMRNGRANRHSSSHWGPRLLTFACAASAGAHAGLAPAHLSGEPRLGAAFLVVVALLMATVIAVAARPWDRRITTEAGLLLAGVMLAYLASRTTGVPVLDPEPEALDAVGIATNGVEAVGVVVAVWLIHPVGRTVRPTHLQEVSR